MAVLNIGSRFQWGGAGIISIRIVYGLFFHRHNGKQPISFLGMHIHNCKFGKY